ncbi:MAG: kynureninase [Chloroflexi bacterium]|nr:kynureninase [Chloroflexota bacterium]MCC6895830.1 kynureninase [Anaerolineae bacterium]
MTLTQANTTALTREALAAMDASDPLASFKEQFYIPQGVLYFDGNSLGAVPKTVEGRLQKAITEEWGNGLVRSWNTAGWYEMPRRLGNKIARLIGADDGEVVVADSTSVNLFKVLAAGVKLNPNRRVILSEPDNFPTDLYMAQGLIQLLGSDHELVLKPANEIMGAIDENTALVMLTHVNYRTGAMHDMNAITAQAHAKGALVIWDLAHSAGALPVDLTGANADFAIGCGYKYLNGGPGAPAFVYVAKRHQPNFSQPLAGWMGHNKPFAFDWKYEPAEGIGRYLAGTQAVLSMTALECGVDVMLEADMVQIREKSLTMADLFIQLVEQRCGSFGLELVTPTDGSIRGSQVSYSHPQGFPIMQALVTTGVIGDYREPNILRFGFTPLYVSFTDIWDTVAILADILQKRTWERPEFQRRGNVT